MGQLDQLIVTVPRGPALDLTAQTQRSSFAVFLEKLVYFAAGLLAGVAVPFLHQPDQFIGLAFDNCQIIIGEFTPLLLDLALNLFSLLALGSTAPHQAHHKEQHYRAQNGY